MSAQVINGEATFLDMNGDPLASGFVYFYTPNTSNFQDTWQDPGLSILNTNPIVLDQAGRAKIWGNMEYRQVVTDQFGNLQWDTITQAGITGQIIGDLDVTGNLTVGGTGTFSGAISAAGLNSSGDVTIAAGYVLNANGLINANAGILSGGEIHVTAGQLLVADGVIDANAGIQSGGEINIAAGQAFVADDWYAQPGQTVVTLHSVLDVVGDSSGLATVRVVGGNNPSFSMGNTAVSTNGGMWNSGVGITFGTTDGAGNAGTSMMYLRITGAGVGNLNVSGDVVPYSNEGSSLGEVGTAWNNVVAHNYVTVSTSVDSEMAEDGFLDVVSKVPVKVEPHMGIAKEDLEEHDWAQVKENKGVNYNVLVGVLWKALQELSDKFDAYVEAHP